MERLFVFPVHCSMNSRGQIMTLGFVSGILVFLPLSSASGNSLITSGQFELGIPFSWGLISVYPSPSISMDVIFLVASALFWTYAAILCLNAYGDLRARFPAMAARCETPVLFLSLIGMWMILNNEATPHTVEEAVFTFSQGESAKWLILICCYGFLPAISIAVALYCAFRSMKPASSSVRAAFLVFTIVLLASSRIFWRW